MEGIRREIAGLLPRIAAFFSIELGLIKLFTHYFSIYRLDVLDYIVAIGAIIGGAFVFSKKGWQVVLPINFFFIYFETYKAIIDFHDAHDVLLCGLAIVCLFIPIARKIKNR